MPHLAPSRRLAAAVALFLIALSQASAADSTALEGKVHLNRLKTLDFSVPHPTLLIVQDTLPLRRLERFSVAGQAGKIRTNVKEHVLDPELRYLARGCGTTGFVPLDCVDSAILAREPELVLVIRDFRSKARTQSLTHFMRTGPGVPGGGPSSPMAFTYESETTEVGAEVLLFDRRTGRILFLATLVGEGSSGVEARQKLADYVVKWLRGVFEPEWPLDRNRNRIGINPAGFVTGPIDPKLIHFSYERLLGAGRNSLAVTTSFHGYSNDQLEFWYLHLPSVALRHYFRRSGGGFWVGGKVGYVQIDNTRHDVWYGTKNLMDATKARLAALSLELGLHTLPPPVTSSIPSRLGLYALLGVGAGAGWRDVRTDIDQPDRYERERGFGFLPTYELAAGLSWMY